MVQQLFDCGSREEGQGKSQSHQTTERQGAQHKDVESIQSKGQGKARRPKVLKTQRAKNGKTSEYSAKEEVKKVVQEESKIRLNLTQKAPVMKHALTNKLRYVSGRCRVG